MPINRVKDWNNSFWLRDLENSQSIEKREGLERLAAQPLVEPKAPVYPKPNAEQGSKSVWGRLWDTVTDPFTLTDEEKRTDPYYQKMKELRDEQRSDAGRSTFQVFKDEAGPSMELASSSLSPFDVIPSNVAQGFDQAGGLIGAAGDFPLRAAEAGARVLTGETDLFSEGYGLEDVKKGAGKSIDSFEERGTLEQIGWSLIGDPTAFLPTSQAGKLKHAPDVIGAVNRSTRQARAELDRAQAYAAVQDSALGAEWVKTIDTASQQDAFHNPPITRGGAATRLADPNANLDRLQPGSLKEVTARAHMHETKARGQADGHIMQVMTGLRHNFGEVRDVFGRSADYDAQPKWKQFTTRLRQSVDGKKEEELYAFGVTHRADGSEIVEPELIGNVLENPALYDLNEQQKLWAEAVSQIVDEAREMAIREGVDITDAKELFNAQHYFPRFRKDARGQFELHLQKVGKGSPIEDQRINEFMERAAYEKGAAYEPAMDSLELYLKSVYDKVITHRKNLELKTFAKLKEIPEEVKLERKTSRNNFARLKKVEDALGKMQNGYWPGRGQWRQMRNALPEMAGEIDRLRALKQEDLGKIIRQVGDDVFRAAKVAPADFWRVYRAKIGQDPAEFVPAAGEAPEVAKRTHEQISRSFKIQMDSVWYLRGPARDAALADAEFAVKRGSEYGVSLEEFKQLELDSFKEFWAARGKTRQRHPSRLVAAQFDSKSDSISAIDDTLKELKITGQEAARLKSAVNAGTQEALGFERRDFAQQLQFTASQSKDTAFERMKAANREYGVEKTVSETASELETPLWNQVYDNADAKHINAKFNREGRETFGILAAVASTARLPLTVVDWSVPLVQNLLLAARDPVLWAKAAKTGAERLRDPKYMQQFLYEHREAVQGMTSAGVVFRSSDIMHGLDEGNWLAGFVVKGIDKLPVGDNAKTALRAGPWGVAKMLHTFGNVYEVQLDAAKVYMWEGLRHQAKTDKDLSDLASFVNKATGTLPGSALGVSRTQQQGESGIMFFAPAYVRAHATIIADAVTQGGLRGSQARESIAKLFMFALHTHIAAASMSGTEPNLDPTNTGKFLKTEVNGHLVGVNNKSMGLIKTGFNMFTKGVTEPEVYISDKFWTAEHRTQNPAFKLLWGQASVPAGKLVDIAHGRNFMDKNVPGIGDSPVEMLKYLGKESLPFWAGAFLDSQETLPDGHKENAYIAGIAESLGVQAFPQGANVSYQRARNDASVKEYGKTFDDMVKAEPSRKAIIENTLLQGHAELRSLYEQQREQMRDRASIQKNVEYDDSVTDEQVKRRRSEVQVVNRLDEEFRYDSQASKVAKANMRRIALEYRGAKRRLGEQYPDVVQERKEWSEENAEPDQIAFSDFYDSLSTPIEEGGVLMPDGSTDRVALKELKDYIDSEYGEGTVKRISRTLYEGRLVAIDHKGDALPMTPTLQEWYYQQIALEPYWNAYEGVVPEQDQVAFVEWDTMDDARRMQELIRNPQVASRFIEYGALVDVERLKLTLSEKELDRLLWKYHGISPKNVENIPAEIEQALYPFSNSP